MNNTVNRGWLKRQIAAGKMEGKVNYSKYGFNDVSGWMPAIVISHYSDREQGKLCIMEDEFHGRHKAYRDTDGTIRMYNGGDSYSFREKQEQQSRESEYAGDGKFYARNDEGEWEQI